MKCLKTILRILTGGGFLALMFFATIKALKDLSIPDIKTLVIAILIAVPLVAVVYKLADVLDWIWSD